MFAAIQRNVVLLIGLALAGVAGAFTAQFLGSPRGALGPTILQSQAPVLALGAVCVFLVVAMLIAGVVGRLVNTAVGLFVMGVGVWVLDGRLATFRELVYASPDPASRSTLIMLAVECLVLGMVVLGCVWGAFKLGGRFQDIQALPDGRVPHPLWSADALRAAAAGAIVPAAVWLLGQSMMKGQMIGATIVGSMVAGLVGRLLSPHVQPILLFASPLIFGAIGHLVGLSIVQPPLDVALVGKKIQSISFAMPLDYVTGALVGVSLGVGWARSFLHHEESAAETEAPAPNASPARS